MALLARFACGCKVRVEIPAPPVVVCAQHGGRARLVATPRGQVRYETVTPTSSDVDAERPS